jgi:4-amino-4-deoxy-L-arabinose transferase-like glycosyltransferase
MPSGDLPSRPALLAVALPLLLLGIFDHELWTPDEPRAAELSREFLEPGHSWSVPTLNGEPFLEKPPLVYWTAALSMKLFGPNAPAARLPCVLFGLGTLAFTLLLGRSLFNPATGRAAAMILATTSGFLLLSHHLESDSGLVCFVAGAAYFLHRALTGSARWFAAFHAAVLGAFFSKGLIAVVFVGLLFGTWLVWTRSWAVLRRPPLWLGLPILIAPIALWLVHLSRDPRGDFLRVFLLENHWGRFTGSEVRLGHSQPFYYYAIQFPARSAPWIAVFLALLPRVRTGLGDPRIRFLLSWLVPGLLFLSAASTKRGIYADPLLPPLALLTAHGLVESGRGRWIAPACGVLAAAAALAALIAIPIVAPRKTLRPFADAAATCAGAGSRICALEPDETTLAVIPFYTGRRVEAVGLGDLERLSRSPTPVLLVVGPRLPSDADQKTLIGLFPVLAWESPPDHSRKMRLYLRK